MKRYALLAAALVLLSQPAPGAERTQTLHARTTIIDGRHTWREDRPYVYSFRVEVISDLHGQKPEGRRDGRPFIEAYPGEEYRVRIHNPLPVRVAANLSIDGLNSITGRPGTPEGGRKWVVEPESWVDISGWQVSDTSARRFFFTSKTESYSAWRSNSWGRDLAVNCGVIGVAYFWSQAELDDYFNEHPIVIRRAELEGGDRSGGRSGSPLPPGVRPEDLRAEEQHAGTGMGERESNPVQQVRFDYDRGMYRTADAVVISYDFEQGRTGPPRPFEDRGYAPEPGDYREGERFQP